MSASTMTMEKANRIAQERIAELEQANEIWRTDFAKLKAENQRLRDAVLNLPVEEMVDGHNGEPVLVGYCMQCQGEWDTVKKLLEGE